TLAENFPRQQAAPRGEQANVARCLRMRPVAHRRFMAEFALVIERQTEESAKNLSRRSRHNAAETARSLHRRVIVEDQVARRFRPFLRMAGDATAIKN